MAANVDVLPNATRQDDAFATDPLAELGRWGLMSHNPAADWLVVIAGPAAYRLVAASKPADIKQGRLTFDTFIVPNEPSPND